MRSTTHSLRVVVVWRSTILQEQTFTQTSDPVVTVGEGDRNRFSVLAPGLPETFEMFERGADGYTVRFTSRVGGTVHLGEVGWSVERLIEEERAFLAGKVRTKKGAADLYELDLAGGDWGRIRLGDVHIFFQLIDQREAVAGRGLSSVEKPLVAMVLLAGLLHGAVLLTAFLGYESDAELEQMQIPESFAEVIVEDVKDPPEPVDEQVAAEETSGKKAGGEEGKFGDPDKQIPSEIPKNDGEMVDEVDPANTGVNEALSSLTMGQGAISTIFDDSQGLSNEIDVAMGGDDEGLQPGRGAAGLGIRGLGDGGGGEDGFGRVHTLGDVDTGGGSGSGGPSTGAELATKERKDVKEFEFRRKPPEVGDFCDKSDIRQVVGGKANAIKYCYEKQLQSQPELSGKIIAQWKVGLDGEVMGASIASSTMNERRVEACITRVISRMRFERPEGGICVIHYPFVFTGIE